MLVNRTIKSSQPKMIKQINDGEAKTNFVHLKYIYKMLFSIMINFLFPVLIDHLLWITISLNDAYMNVYDMVCALVLPRCPRPGYDRMRCALLTGVICGICKRVFVCSFSKASRLIKLVL